MSTTVLNAQSIAYPTISNRIRVDISTQLDPLTIVATEIDAIAGHPARIWSFPGLPRTNYRFVMNEIDGSGNPINQLAYFDVVPNLLDGGLARDDEQIFPGVTPGFYDGATHIRFDGATIPQSDLAVHATGNIDASHWWFTLEETSINPGDVVEVHYDIDSTSYTAATVAKYGQTLTDIIADLLAQIQIIAPGAALYSTGGFDGIQIPAITTATGSVIVTDVADSKKPDYLGWNINPERINKPGTMVRGQEYTWNITTGDFDLLIEGDIFVQAEPYNIDFDVIEQDAGGSVGVVPEFTTQIITTDYTVQLADFGNKFIVEPASDFITIHMPDISVCPANLPISIEVDRNADNCCVQVLENDVDTVQFLWGKIFMCRKETLRIYKFIRYYGIYEWRIDNACGNYSKAGKIIDFDNVEDNMFDYLLCDGRTLSTDKYARLYDYVQRLPVGQVITFGSWSTGNNKTMFSTASGGLFHIPDRRGLYARATVADLAGIYYRMQLELHNHLSPYCESSLITVPPFGHAGFTNRYGNAGANDTDNDWWFTNNGGEFPGANQLNSAGVVGTETRPNSYSINKYVIL